MRQYQNDALKTKANKFNKPVQILFKAYLTLQQENPGQDSYYAAKRRLSHRTMMSS